MSTLPDHIVKLVDEYAASFPIAVSQDTLGPAARALRLADALVAYLAEERAAKARAPRAFPRVYCYACHGGGGQALTGRACDRCAGSGWEPE